MPETHQKPERKTARFAAIETLAQLERTRLPVVALFDKVAAECSLDGPDRHLAMNILYGVLRHRQELDFLLQSLCKQPASKIKPFVRQALLAGLYQLFFLDRIPESAAVNESVKALQAAHLPKNLQGFVNGVLRESLRRKQTLVATLAGYQDSSGNPFLNHPDWLVKRWQARYGQEEMQRICAVNNQQAPLILHVNTLVTTREQLLAAIEQEEIVVHSGAYSPDALILPDFHGPISKLPGFFQGHFQVQDEAAQLLTLLMGPLINNGHYLDACAGLGGKTSGLIQLRAAGNARSATIAAVEPELQRQHKFRDNMHRLHPDEPVTLYDMDIQHFAQTCDRRFDGILIDAPCSGTGVTGRHPDIRWNRQKSDLARYQKLQLQLLAEAARLLAPAGILVYATCSLEPEENEEVVALFLEQHPDFISEDCAQFLPPSAKILVKEQFFAPRPGPSIDGFFGARLRRI